MNFGLRTGEKEAVRMIDYALDQGINLIDTANVYGRTGEADEGIGRPEEIIGRALARSGKRSQVILATKVFGRVKQSDPNAGGLSRRHIIQEVENSLRRLQTENLDLYQLHRPQAEIPIDETLRALDDLIRSGKVRYVGTSFFAPGQIVESLWVSNEHRLNRFVGEQPPYSMLSREIERQPVPVAQKYDIALLTFSPLDGGLLTDKCQRGEDFPAGSRFTTPYWGEFYRSGLSEEVWETLASIRALAVEKGCTTSQLALTWATQQPGITSVIVGPRTMEQLRNNLACLEVVISGEDREAIGWVSPPGTSLMKR